MKGDAEVELACDPSQPAVAFVFKMLADPFSGHVNVFRVFQGTMSSDSQVVIARDGRERLGHLLKLEGKKQSQVATAVAGDIVAPRSSRTRHRGHAVRREAARSTIRRPRRARRDLVRAPAKSKGDEDKS